MEEGGGVQKFALTCCSDSILLECENITLSHFENILVHALFTKSLNNQLKEQQSLAQLTNYNDVA